VLVNQSQATGGLSRRGKLPDVLEQVWFTLASPMQLSYHDIHKRMEPLKNICIKFEKTFCDGQYVKAFFVRVIRVLAQKYHALTICHEIIKIRVRARDGVLTGLIETWPRGSKASGCFVVLSGDGGASENFTGTGLHDESVILEESDFERP
jgi:hypothetical protein